MNSENKDGSHMDCASERIKQINEMLAAGNHTYGMTLGTKFKGDLIKERRRLNKGRERPKSIVTS